MAVTAYAPVSWQRMSDAVELIDVGLVDAAWLERVSEPLRPRLRQILENPEG